MKLQKSVLAIAAALSVSLFAGAAHAGVTYKVVVPVPGFKASATAPGSGPGSGTPETPAEAKLSLNTAMLSFGTIALGTTSGTYSVTVSNTGGKPLGITDVSLSAGASDFSLLNTCGTIAPGASCRVDLTMTPAGTGTRTGTLVVAGGAQASTVALVGTGAGSDVQLPGQVDLGTVETSDVSSKTVTIQNAGNQAASAFYVDMLSSAQLYLANNLCGTAAQPITLAAGTSCTVDVVWKPNGQGNWSSTLTAAWAGKSLSSPVRGVATQAQLQLSPAAVALGTLTYGTPKSAVVQVTNNGNAKAHNLYPLATGAGVSIKTSTCGTQAVPVVLPVGATCSFSVEHDAGAMGDLPAAAAAYVLSDALNSNIKVPVTGTVTGSQMTLTAGDLVFGTVAKDVPVTKALTFKNTGQISSSITGLNYLPTEFAVSANDCSNVSPNASCSVSVRMTPSNIVTYSNVTVTTKGLDANQSTTLSATVIPAMSSCQAIKAANPSAASGLYSIDPDGAGGLAATQVYCDMVTDGGGWTLVARVAEANRNHVNAAAVGALTSPSQGTTAKLADSYLNAISASAWRFSYDANGGALYVQVQANRPWQSAGTTYNALRYVSATVNGTYTALGTPEAAYIGFGCYHSGSGGWLRASGCFNWGHASANGSEVQGYSWNQKINFWVR